MPRGDSFDVMDVNNMLSKACQAAGSQSAWAKAHGVSPAYVNDVLQSRRDPGPSILSALGLREVVRYVKKRKDDDGEKQDEAAVAREREANRAAARQVALEVRAKRAAEKPAE